jgi:hypothetical protein
LLFNKLSHSLDKKLIDLVFTTICHEGINIRDFYIERVLVKLVESNSNNFEKIESYLHLCRGHLGVKLIEKIVDCFYKVSSYIIIEK